jgi:hypothetical protein
MPAGQEVTNYTAGYLTFNSNTTLEKFRSGGDSRRQMVLRTRLPAKHAKNRENYSP